jgi:hypothetical protein
MKKLLVGSLVLTLFAAANIIFQMSSCTKTDAQTGSANYPIEGLWIGTYTVDGNPGLGEQYFSFAIKPGGTIITDTKWATQQHLATGTWSLTGTTLTTSFTCVYGLSVNVGITELTTATWDKTGKLAGTWKNIAPLTGSGNIKLTRVN